MKRLFNLSLLFLIGIVFVIPVNALAGNIDSNYKYAWGNYTGWVNFNPRNGDVEVTNTGITGYAWSDNFGWINLNPTNGGVKNDENGNLSGYAWSENIGWINFSGVKISCYGRFSGKATALDTSYGEINFNCTNCIVNTTWTSGPCTGGNYYVSCGDKFCNGSETCKNCPLDCGECKIENEETTTQISEELMNKLEAMIADLLAQINEILKARGLPTISF